MSGKQKRGKMIILSSILLAALAAAFVIVRLPSFGRLPQGERLERIRQSPNYRDGRFRNQEAGPMMTGDKSRLRGILEFLFRKREGLRPQDAVPAIRTDLRALDSKSNLLVWFGHSSYLIQAEGRRTLVDPVFRSAAPLSLLNRPFKGTDIYRPEEMPDIDYLIVTHDHWDHLDYRTVRELKERIGTVICPLGVGEHFEYWGFDPAKIVELDWHEQQTLGDGFTVRCLPSRHFSGRGRSSNQTLWGSFLLQTPARKIYMGGDGGYGCHFAEIGEEFPDIDLAVLENGQYDEAWKYIHTDARPTGQSRKRAGCKADHDRPPLEIRPCQAPLGRAAGDRGGIGRGHRAAPPAARNRRGGSAGNSATGACAGRRSDGIIAHRTGALRLQRDYPGSGRLIPPEARDPHRSNPH